MALAHSQILVALFVVSCFVFPVVLGYRTNDVRSWCGKTPNPVPCEYFLSNDQKNIPIKDEPDFLKVAMHLALERATHAERNAYSLGTKCRNEREKAAWSDCLKLYELTVLSLNKTVESSPNLNKDDRQTWLSTALTNLETCRNGFIELGVPDYLPPMMSNNVSKLISNTLALNKAPYKEPTYKDGFPTWVKPGDRKLLQSSSPASRANIVVAQDGSGNYRTIKDAISAASKRSGSGRYVIYVKAGTYRENVEIGSNLKNIMMAGDGIGKTIITGSKSVGGGSTTFSSATFAVVGDGFIGRDITFRNTAGPRNQQAVALRSGSDLSVFYRCSFEGYQDTLYVHSERQFYRECDIHGTVDFIFGNSACVLQNCNIYARNPPNKTNTVTAQGRTDPNQNTGIIIHNSRVTAASDLRPVQGSVKTYLGRPWKQYSRTVFMKTYLDSLINPAGWMEWDGNFALNTLYYAEYMNTGPGSSTSNRVKWRGYRILRSAGEASRFTAGEFLAGNSWLASTGVPYTLGL
ncbi:putative pectinesterase/pectinesterase inhibitor 33 [Hibiscus syriacus]|uniref:Pectinesterase n=1 Tax=Hibiscus syriacus TaxID=106335 RepID=A0A6A3A9T4_HIBSY|nr:pectinesterase 2-like [Hibiscus syriacus]KAE8699719.1 putative pectinesterase/pectinesterase inhibitor 33 [Hibiscus syriacus]